jgi:hypothetical protein
MCETMGDLLRKFKWSLKKIYIILYMEINKMITILILNYIFKDYDTYDPDDIDDVGSIYFTSESDEERWD